jgi:protein disulfide-isomerase A6
MKILFIILAVLLILLVLLRLYMNNYHEGFEGSSKGIIICKASWCGHCKTAAPEFNKLLSASPITLKDGSKATVKILDADNDKDEISKLKIKGYPTIFVKNDSQMIEYPGERTSSAIIDFFNEML